MKIFLTLFIAATLLFSTARVFASEPAEVPATEKSVATENSAESCEITTDRAGVGTVTPTDDGPSSKAVAQHVCSETVTQYYNDSGCPHGIAKRVYERHCAHGIWLCHCTNWKLVSDRCVA